MGEFGERSQDMDTEVDPAAAFLAREQSDLAGLELELEGEEAKTTASTILSNGDGSVDYSVSSFEVIGDSETRIDAGVHSEMHDIFGGISPTPMTGGGGSGGGSDGGNSIVVEEQENIRKWREEQVKRLEIKDKEEEVKKQEWREVARKELEDWYHNHEDVIAKTKAQNRNAEKQFVAEDGEISPGTEWERIARLCDFNPKVKGASGTAVSGASGASSHSPRDRDVSRMRTIILQRKQAQQQQQTQSTAA